jgi:enoyl-CoA hydratase/carnithine racemase
MANDAVLLEVRDGVAHVAEPSRRRARSTLTWRRLLAAASIEHDPAVRAVLLARAGARFCGGGDVRGFHEAGGTLTENIRDIPALHNDLDSRAQRCTHRVAVQECGRRAWASSACRTRVAGESARL